ncbi:hypothetical protein L581_2222 [Serratia fonticola AU-AP2C]|nr:hypothetical protein L581_2222 [Serratia fonticola AU-AP2C]
MPYALFHTTGITVISALLVTIQNGSADQQTAPHSGLLTA